MLKNKKILIILISFFLVLFSFILYAGKFLIINNKLEKSDIILLFLGNSEREKHVIDIYRADYADKIIFMQGIGRSKPYVRYDSSIVYSNASRVLKTLIDSGIPDSCINVLQNDVINTADEAAAFFDFIKGKNDINNIIVVSSPYHMRRIHIMFSYFQNKHKKNIEVLYSPSLYGKFKSNGWWKHKRNRKLVINEYLKIINFLFIDKYRF